MNTPVLTGLLTAALMLAGRAADPARESLQKGLVEEESNRDLEAAVQAYQAAVDQYDDQRRTAATAVFRLAECYRKLGRTNEAAMRYERVLRDFTEQTNLVTLSRNELDRMPQFRARVGSGATGAAVESAAADDPLARQKELLQQELALVEQSLGAAQKRFESGQSSNEEVLTIRRDILSLKRQMAELDAKRPVRADLLSSVQPPTEPGTSGEPGTSIEEAQEIARLKALKENSPDLLEVRGGFGRSPLHFAVGKQYHDAAAYLLDQGVNVDARDQRGNTPLHVAVAGGYKRLVELLLARGAKATAKNVGGTTPLHVAAGRGFKVIAEVLLANGAEVDAIAEEGNLYGSQGTGGFPDFYIGEGTPLNLAVAQGFRSMVELLLAHQAELNPKHAEFSSPLALAAGVGNVDIVMLLLERGSEVNGKGDLGNTALHGVARAGSEEILRLLLPHQPQLDIRNLQDLTPLQLAIISGQIKVAAELLKAGANPNVRYEAKGVVPVQAYGSQNSLPGDGATPLHWAVQWGFGSTVESLLKAGADVNAQDTHGNGNTPLHRATENPGTAILETLLAHGAQVNAKTRDDWTPLHFAVLRRNREAIELLLAKGADPAAKNKDGQAPLDFVTSAIRSAPILVPGPARALPPMVPRQPGSAPGASEAEIAELLLKHTAKQ